MNLKSVPRTVIAVGIAWSFMTGLAACTKKGADSSAPVSAEETAAKMVEKGRRSYAMNCTSCHNPNPKIDGSVGPAVAGSSLELVRARLLEAKYPEGYKPKRETRVMPALVNLKDDVEALHAFLNAP